MSGFRRLSRQHNLHIYSYWIAQNFGNGMFLTLVKVPLFALVLKIMLLEWETQFQVTDGWTDTWMYLVIHFRCDHPSALRFNWRKDVGTLHSKLSEDAKILDYQHALYPELFIFTQKRFLILARSIVLLLLYISETTYLTK